MQLVAHQPTMRTRRHFIHATTTAATTAVELAFFKLDIPDTFFLLSSDIKEVCFVFKRRTRVKYARVRYKQMVCKLFSKHSVEIDDDNNRNEKKDKFTLNQPITKLSQHNSSFSRQAKRKSFNIIHVKQECIVDQIQPKRAIHKIYTAYATNQPSSYIYALPFYYPSPPKNVFKISE